MRTLLAINLFLFLLNFSSHAFGRDVKMVKWGDTITLVDETQLKFPNDYSADFEEDTLKKAEIGDAYDERIESLPSFDLWQNGRKIGTTQVPIVTRKKSYWSTSLGTTREGIWWQTTKQWQGTSESGEKEGKGAAEEGDNEVKEEQNERSSSGSSAMPTTKMAKGMRTETAPTSWLKGMSTTTIANRLGSRHQTMTATTKNEHREAWSRSWSVGPDGTMEMHTWESGKGEKVEKWKMLPGETPKKLVQSPRNEGGDEPTTERTTKEANRNGNWQKNAVTSKCNVLDAAKDGRPSKDNDNSCKLAFPGISADDTCKCSYTVAARDPKGCAIGFIYTCKRVN